MRVINTTCTRHPFFHLPSFVFRLVSQLSNCTERQNVGTGDCSRSVTPDGIPSRWVVPLTGFPTASASDLSAEVIDLIFEAYVALYPKKRGRITLLSHPFRERFRSPWSVEIYVSTPFVPSNQPSRGKVVVLRSKLRSFLEDLSSFAAVFPDSLTFGEIENVHVHLPFDTDSVVPLLRAAFKSLPRVKQVKFSAWVDVVDLQGFMRDVGRVGSGLAQATSLTLAYSAWDVTPVSFQISFGIRPSLRLLQLPSYLAWHMPFFLRNLSPFSNLTSIKLRTALPMFKSPDDSDTDDEPNEDTRRDAALAAASLQTTWLEKLRAKLPALNVIHLAESQDESLGVVNWEYIGTRTLWYKTEGCWRVTEWAWPGGRHLPGGWRPRSRRTTRKANFDPWGSDGEYSELEETGW